MGRCISQLHKVQLSTRVNFFCTFFGGFPILYDLFSFRFLSLWSSPLCFFIHVFSVCSWDVTWGMSGMILFKMTGDGTSGVCLMYMVRVRSFPVFVLSARCMLVVSVTTNRVLCCACGKIIARDSLSATLASQFLMFPSLNLNWVPLTVSVQRHFPPTLSPPLLSLKHTMFPFFPEPLCSSYELCSCPVER